MLVFEEKLEATLLKSVAVVSLDDTVRPRVVVVGSDIAVDAEGDGRTDVDDETETDAAEDTVASVFDKPDGAADTEAPGDKLLEGVVKDDTRVEERPLELPILELLIAEL